MLFSCVNSRSNQTEKSAFCERELLTNEIQPSAKRNNVLLWKILLRCRRREKVNLFIVPFFRFLKQDVRDELGNTPLHLAINENTPVDDFHVKWVVKYFGKLPNSPVLAQGDHDDLRSKTNGMKQVIAASVCIFWSIFCCFFNPFVLRWPVVTFCTNPFYIFLWWGPAAAWQRVIVAITVYLAPEICFCQYLKDRYSGEPRRTNYLL